ncbi:MAG: histidine phosphatase family protein [Actinomycetales bacterium]|nr:histidine phosphatase family protein [Actinomycetales bacterium]
MTTVVLWRHGRTEYNATRRLQGQIDIPLDEVGRWQGTTAAAALFARHTPARIVSSDLARAAQTAQYLADLAGLDVELDARLRERAFGDWEGLTAEEIHAGFPDEAKVWSGGGGVNRPGAENPAQVGERVAAAVRELAEGLEGTLVLVTHGAAIALGLSALLGQDPAAWRGIAGIDNAHWSQLTPTRDGVTPGWRLAAHNVGPSVSTADWFAGRGHPD